MALTITDRENLSKYKYICRIYKTKDNIHFETFPIIYSNKFYIYYKDGRYNALNCINLSYWGYKTVFTDLDSLYQDLKGNTQLYLLTKYRLDFDEKEQKRNLFKQELIKELEDKQKELENKHKELEALNEKYEQIKKQLKEIKGE